MCQLCIWELRYIQTYKFPSKWASKSRILHEIEKMIIPFILQGHIFNISKRPIGQIGYLTVLNYWKTKHKGKLHKKFKPGKTLRIKNA